MEYKNTYNNINDNKYSHSEAMGSAIVHCVQNRNTTDESHKSIINKRPIAFFDSGVGGLTVFEKVKKLLPDENYLYFGDTKNMPYGEKSRDQLLEFADKIFRFFEKHSAKAVVMACNTTSAITYDILKDNYNFVVYPIIQSVCSTLAKLENVDKLGVIATPATINSMAYSKEIAKYNKKMKVYELAAPSWVRIVEEHRINAPQSIFQVKEIIEQMNEHNPDKIVLACTHYPYLLNVLKNFTQEDKFIDPAVYFAQNIKQDLTRRNLLNNEHEYEKFYVSSDPQNFKEASEMFYKVENVLLA